VNVLCREVTKKTMIEIKERW